MAAREHRHDCLGNTAMTARKCCHIAVDAVVYYKIRDPMAAVCNVQDAAKSTKLLASTTLRNILGTKTLAEILSDRESIGENLLTQLDAATDPWGIEVTATILSKYRHLKSF